MDYTKICKVCQEEFPATNEYFNKAKLGKYGLTAKCKKCLNNYMNNVDKIYKNGVIVKSSLTKYASPSRVHLMTSVIISTPASMASLTACLYSGSIIEG